MTAPLLPLQPAEHAAWGPGVSPEYPELSGSEDESDAEGEGGSSSDHSSSAGPSTSSSLAALLGAAGAGAATAASRPQRPPPARWCMDPRTLRFADRKLERRFQLWRNRRLAKVRLQAARWLRQPGRTAGASALLALTR